MDALESLDVWKKACQLSVTIYGLMDKCRDLGLNDQITRSALSIPSNITEGYERDYVPEMVRFFRIAKGSAGELRTQLYIGTRAGFINAEACIEASREISKMLQGLINHYQQT